MVAVLRELADRQDWWISNVLAGVAAGGDLIQKVPEYGKLRGAVQGRIEVADEFRALADSIESGAHDAP